MRLTISTRLAGVRRQGNGYAADLASDFAPDWGETRAVDLVVADHGTAANADLYHALKPLSRNLGALDYAALLRGETPFAERNGDGAFWLYRIGDAVSARNIHAGIYDALRFGLRI